jgi:hypothetical protein
MGRWLKKISQVGEALADSVDNVRTDDTVSTLSVPTPCPIIISGVQAFSLFSFELDDHLERDRFEEIAGQLAINDEWTRDEAEVLAVVQLNRERRSRT